MQLYREFKQKIISNSLTNKIMLSKTIYRIIKLIFFVKLLLIYKIIISYITQEVK